MAQYTAARNIDGVVVVRFHDLNGAVLKLDNIDNIEAMSHELLTTARDVDQSDLCAQERAIVRSTIRVEIHALLEGMDTIRMAVDEELCDLDEEA